MIALAEVLGFLFLWIPCLLNAWTKPTYPSIKPVPGRELVDQWKWNWLNKWYANTEDGVSGQQAIIYVDDQGHLGPYMPEPNVRSRFAPVLLWFWDSYRAYAWSAWRNGANNIKRPLRTDGLTQVWKP